MKRKKLGLIHTSATLVPVFQQLCQEKLKDVDVFNIVDDSLIKDTIAKGRLVSETAWRVAGHVHAAESAGADAILVTCSSIGAAVEASAALAGVPVVRVDQPMADQAVRTGRKVGVVATLETTMEPTADLIRRRAVAAGRQIEILPRLCQGAFAALMAGDTATHDAAVKSTIERLAQEADVVVLAQASMARVIPTLSDAARRVPILTSPPIAVDHMATVFAAP